MNGTSLAFLPTATAGAVGRNGSTHPKPTPSQLAMQAVIRVLEARGFVPDGHTATTTVPMHAVRSPTCGSSDAIACTFGGRVRYSKPGTRIMATVGKQTTCVYLANIKRFRFGGRRRALTTNLDLASGHPVMAVVDTKDMAMLKVALERIGRFPSARHQ